MDTCAFHGTAVTLWRSVGQDGLKSVLRQGYPRRREREVPLCPLSYQHCGQYHLNRYLAEFDFRYNNHKAHGVEDMERAEKLLRGVTGKRLTYETTAH